MDERSDAEIAYERYSDLMGIERPWSALTDRERYIWRAVLAAVDLERAKRGGPSKRPGTGPLDPSKVLP